MRYLDRIICVRRCVLGAFGAVGEGVAVRWTLVSLFLSSCFFLYFSFSSVGFFTSFVGLDAVGAVATPVKGTTVVLASYELLVRLSRGADTVKEEVDEVRRVG